MNGMPCGFVSAQRGPLLSSHVSSCMLHRSAWWKPAAFQPHGARRYPDQSAASSTHRPHVVAASPVSHSGPPAGQQQVAAVVEERLLQRARQLYEDVWSQGKILLLNTIMAEEHAQVDRVWQQSPGIGRQRMKRGILAYRKAYPDILFTVQDVGVAESGRKVFVSWRAQGTNTGPIREQPPTGRAVAFAGVSILHFNEEGQIAQSEVFRQAPEDEKNYFLGQMMQAHSQAKS